MRIAILEDDPDQLALLERWLRQAGHQIYGYLAGKEILRHAPRENFDLFVLDWEVPDLSGIEVLQQIRSKMSTTVPVLFVTVRDTEKDIVLALNTGADDYMIKPVRQSETLARVGALLRRAYPLNVSRRLSFPPYEFDLDVASVKVNGAPVELTPKEFELATAFFQSIDQLMSRSRLQQVVWGHGSEVESRTVDTHVSNIRKKLGLRGENGFRIAAIYNYGYRLKKVEPELAKVFARKEKP